jgi:prepilin signal peptidase PulO-like enzyme (type II secretory pathway)
MTNVFENLHDLHVSPAGAWVLVAYAAFLGGAIGSFLNVVAYRLPLGLNLSRPGSRCPSCKHPIRWYHNVPVLGWLVLRGRCYDCGAAISWRYPLVELLVALASGLVCWSAFEPTVIEGEQEYIADLLAVGFRLLLLYTLFAAALLEFDGNPLPLRLLVGVTVLAALAVWLAPQLRPVGGDAVEPPPLTATVIAGGTAILMSLLAWPALISRGTSRELRDASARGVALVLAAVILGFNAILIVAAGSAAMVLASRLLAHVWPQAARIGWAAALLAVTLLWMIAISPTAESHNSISIGSGFGHFGGAIVTVKPMAVLPVGVLVAILSLAARFVSVRLPGRKS